MDHATMEYWIGNSDSFLHQIFMIVMGGLYGLAWLFGISYKAANIYFYFVLFPLSFLLFLKGWKRFLVFPVSLIFFLFPGYKEFSIWFFDRCVEFLNYSAEKLGSNYIEISIYLCVLIPMLLYVPFFIAKVPRKSGAYFLAALIILSGLYMSIIYPDFRTLLMYVQDHYA